MGLAQGSSQPAPQLHGHGRPHDVAANGGPSGSVNTDSSPTGVLRAVDRSPETALHSRGVHEPAVCLGFNFWGTE